MVERAVHAAEKLAGIAEIVGIAQRVDFRIKPVQRPGVVVGHQAQMLVEIHGRMLAGTKAAGYAL